MHRFVKDGVPLLLCALALAAPFAQANDSPAAPYPCSNAREGRGFVTPAFSALLDKTPAEPQALEALRSQAQGDMELALIDMAALTLDLQTGHVDAARERLLKLVANPYVPRAQTDQFRWQLAHLALRARDPASAIAWLEPVAKANCAPLPPSAYYVLADAYLQSQRPADALEILDRAGPPTLDVDWWRAKHTELTCSLRASPVCVQHIATLARHGGLGPDLTQALEAQLTRVLADPAATAELQAAREAGLISDEGRILPRAIIAVVEMMPVKRLAPTYPARALRDRISGFVRLGLQVDADGEVTKAWVVDASPKGVFEGAALKAARRARFVPRDDGGVTRASEGQYTVIFQIAP